MTEEKPPSHDENGRFAKGNRAGKLITAENHAHYMQLRKEKPKKVALQALNDAALDFHKMGDVKDAVDEFGWYAVIHHLTTVLLKTNNPKGLAELAKLLGSASGNIEKEVAKEADGDLTVSSDMRRFIGDLADIVRGQEDKNEKSFKTIEGSFK